MSAPLRYDYKPKRHVMVLGGLFFAGCAIVLAGSARENVRGIVINGLVRLDPSEATGFLWILVALSILFVVAALVGFSRSFGPPRQLVVDDAGITAPRNSWSRAVVAVRFGEMTDLQVSKVQSQRFLTIRHTGGKLVVPSAMLPSAEDFNAVVDAIAQRLPSASAH